MIQGGFGKERCWGRGLPSAPGFLAGPPFSCDMPPAHPPLRTVALLTSPEELRTIMKTQATANTEQQTSLRPWGTGERVLTRLQKTTVYGLQSVSTFFCHRKGTPGVTAAPGQVTHLTM